MKPSEKRAKLWEQQREQREREQRDRILAVIAEFGGQARQPMLEPEDDPANNEVILRLVDEVLFQRDQIRRIGNVMELVQAGKPFAPIPPGPSASLEISAA
jgi:hypothetical protein